MLTKIEIKTWTHFLTSNTLKASQARSLSYRHLHGRRRMTTSAPKLRWGIALLSHRNVTLRVALKWIYKTIPTTHLRSVKSINISRVRSRRKTWRHTLTMCWRRKTPLFVTQASQTGIASKCSWLVCQMMRPSGSGNYTLSIIWDEMKITNALSNTAVETSSKAWDSWCRSRPTPSIFSTPIGVALIVIRHWNASIQKSTPWTGGVRHM